MKNRIISLLLVATVALSLSGCGSKDNKTPSADSPTSEEEKTSYNITVCLGEDNEYNNHLVDGFTDCLYDYIPANNLIIKKLTVDDDTSSDAVAVVAKSSSPDLIYTVGSNVLASTAAATETIPIVAAGIVDYQTALRIANVGGKSWNKTSGRNITGVTSRPSIADQVSLMIEATPNLSTVGILFSAEDTDSIYQNEIFENYLDQAGIPWKEYEIPASDTAIESEEDDANFAVSPSKFVAISAKAGMNNDVEPLGEDLITGINSPSSTRTASVSRFWTGPKFVEDSEDFSDDSENQSDEDNQTSADDISDDSQDEATEENEPFEFTDETPISDRISFVCKECSSIYIPFGSMLTDQMPLIGEIATAAGVTTISGDMTLCENALVTLFYDPYALGYASGKKAVSVLLKGTDISSIKITAGNTDDVVKIYNKEIAEKLGITFPKSFSEYHEFLETYEYGSTTKRHTLKSADEED